MSIVAVAVVKDECDIIELFVRSALEWADRLCVVDNGSTDGTQHILRLLAEEGLPIDVSQDRSIDHQQSRIISRLMRDAFADPQVTHVVPLDADEFVTHPHQFVTEVLATDARMCGRIQWAGLVPGVGKLHACTNPLLDFFQQRSTEVRNVFKVVVPRQLGLSGAVSEGNHELLSSAGNPIDCQTITSSRLAHAPVRSANQILSKALIGSHKLSIKHNRRPNEGFHWDAMADLLRTNNYEISHDMLRRLALAYGTSTGDPVPTDTQRIEATVSACQLRYASLSNVDPIARLDRFAADLCRSYIDDRSSLNLAIRILRAVWHRIR